jgi:hypothetical protein
MIPACRRADDKTTLPWAMSGQWIGFQATQSGRFIREADNGALTIAANAALADHQTVAIHSGSREQRKNTRAFSGIWNTRRQGLPNFKTSRAGQLK